MAYAPIAKLKKFTSEEDNAQVWLNDIEKAIAANRWNDARAMKLISKPELQVSNSESIPKLGSIHTSLHPNAPTANLLITSISSSNLSTDNTCHLSIHATKDASSNNQESNQTKSLNNNILPATITNNKLLAAIFPFEFKEPLQTLLFSGATLEEKPITAMYTNAKVDDHRVDQAVSVRIITADRATKTPIGEIDNLLIEINSIYKQLAHMCTSYKKKPTWEAYQVLWTNTDHNKLPPWKENNKKKEKEKEEKPIPTTTTTYILYTYTLTQSFNYC
ncbi:hypothetical protein G9A89_004987 [Geosiphon pyriformis]|nr:hypothetical protein G9A89_004987 [Geosiphon pyriformis]